MTTTIPDLPVPPGARPDTWRNVSPLPYRVLLGETRRVNDRRGFDAADVQPTALQFSDGTSTTAACTNHPRCTSATSYPAEQARELAAAIIEAANTIDAWVKR